MPPTGGVGWGRVLSQGKGVKIRLYESSLSSSADPNA